MVLSRAYTHFVLIMPFLISSPEAENELRVIITGKGSGQSLTPRKLSLKVDLITMSLSTNPLLSERVPYLYHFLSQLKQNYTHCTDLLTFSKPKEQIVPLI